MSFTEDNYEKAVTALFEQMGYTHLYGPDIEREQRKATNSNK